MSPEAATTTLSVVQTIEKSGDLKDSATYARMGCFPMIGREFGIRIVASSDQKLAACSVSLALAAANHCASVARMDASSFATSTSGWSVRCRVCVHPVNPKLSNVNSNRIRILICTLLLPSSLFCNERRAIDKNPHLTAQRRINGARLCYRLFSSIKGGITLTSSVPG